MTPEQWAKFQDFQNEHKDLLIMIACPKDDSISISFGGLNAFVRFPGNRMEEGVIFNALRKSKFKESIDPLMTGIIEATGISEKGPGGELLKTVGGAVMGIGNQKEIIKNNLLKKSNGKNKTK